MIDSLSPQAGARSSATALLVQYLGFQDAPGRREYAIGVRRGDQSHRYTLWIERAAFAERRALLQDGPDICYQKLLRELAGSELPAPDAIEVTDGDLAAYRETHAAPVRKGFTPARPEEPKPEPEKAPLAEGGEIPGAD